MSLIIKCVSILLLLTSMNARFLEVEFLEREDGDSLIYMETIATTPTAEDSCHSVHIVWTSTELRYTDVILEMAGIRGPSYGIYHPNRTYFTIGVEDTNTTQLVVTVLAYGRNITDVPPSIDRKMESRQYFGRENKDDENCLDFD